MSTHPRQNSQKRYRAAAKRGKAISPERRARLALDWQPVGVVERMEIDAMPADMWLARVVNDPKISADAKVYAERVASYWREHGHLPEELFT